MKRVCKFIGVFILTMMLSLTLQKTAFAANDSIDSAITYNVGTTQNGNITSDQEYYYYKFNLTQSGRINVKTTVYTEWIYLYLFNDAGEELWETNPRWNSTSEVIVNDCSFDLIKGTYYYCVRRDGSRFGQYSFGITFTPADETFEETGTGINNTLASAEQINAFGTWYKGQLAMNDRQDYYKFYLQSSGLLTLNLIAGMEWINAYVYDDMGNELWHINPKWNSTSERIVEEHGLDLTNGWYFLRIYNGNITGNYEFKLDFTSANESFTETNGGSNNTMADASAIQFDRTYIGQLAINDDKDFYKIQVASAQNLSLYINAKMENLYVTVYDGAGNEIWRKWLPWNSTSGEIAYTNNELKVQAGTYYIVISRDRNNGNYSFRVGTYYSITKISLNSSKKMTEVGKSFSLYATIHPSNASNKNIVWSSGNEYVAKVAGGTVKTYHAGVAEIKAVSEADNGVMAVCRVIVKPQKVKLKKLKKYSTWSGRKGFLAAYSVNNSNFP